MGHIEGQLDAVICNYAIDIDEICRGFMQRGEVSGVIETMDGVWLS